MTNLEFYKDEINKCIENGSGELATVYMRVGQGFNDFSKRYVQYYPHNSLAFVDWLLEEHKEPIKLKQFEKDLLECYTYVDNSWNGRILHENYTIRYMCDKGYFKNVDLNMTFREVLDNCEVVE